MHKTDNLRSMKLVFLSIIIFILCFTSSDIFAAVERTKLENKDQTGLAENFRNNKSGSLSKGKILRNMFLGTILNQQKNTEKRESRNDNIRFSMLSIMTSIVAIGLIAMKLKIALNIALVLGLSAIVLGAIGFSRDKYWGIAAIALFVAIGAFLTGIRSR